MGPAAAGRQRAVDLRDPARPGGVLQCRVAAGYVPEPVQHHPDRHQRGHLPGPRGRDDVRHHHRRHRPVDRLGADPVRRARRRVRGPSRRVPGRLAGDRRRDPDQPRHRHGMGDGAGRTGGEGEGTPVHRHARRPRRGAGHRADRHHRQRRRGRRAQRPGRDAGPGQAVRGRALAGRGRDRHNGAVRPGPGVHPVRPAPTPRRSAAPGSASTVTWSRCTRWPACWPGSPA